ncbi:class III lanthionine synthetase LanKC [Longispora sp. NPDC051575]|uniref:class III lanthionine synthetase LanKC n=1 Tax=Longispora sp. NPDC051575 TaxID=3154943 RepID=UPI00343C86B8
MKLDWQLLTPFCLGDQDFFETPARMPDEAELLSTARRAAPDGWSRVVRDWWVSLKPDGGVLPVQGWKIHVSATVDSADKVCGSVWDYCVDRGLSFKFLRSNMAVRFMNSKYAPRSGSGKLVTIYPADEAQFSATVLELSLLLENVTGPYILSDLRVGKGPVYVRYGAFVELTCTGDDGDPVPALFGPDGQLIPDQRGPVFVLPEWVQVPDVLRTHLEASRSDGALDFPYVVDSALHYSNGGGVYRGRDAVSGQKVVLLEARPHAGMDPQGADAVARLQRQREVLRRLAGLDCVPRLIDYRVAWEHHFLIEEYIEGKSLLETMQERHVMILDPDPVDEQLAEYTTWVLDLLQKIENAVAAVHSRGLRFGDLHPRNVMVRPDGNVTLVDFEFTVDLDDQEPAIGAPGFTPPTGVVGAAADWYQLSCVRLFLFLPLELRPDRAPAQLSHLLAGVKRNFPVPSAFLGMLRRGLEPVATRDHGIDPGEVLVGEGTPDWPAIRASLVAAIEASATPDREDRLFPGDPQQFNVGGHTFAYGAAGVLYALRRAGVEVSPRHIEWLVRATRGARQTRPGLFDGLHGVAATLDVVGRRAEALETLDRARAHVDTSSTVTMMGGHAGMALNLLHFFGLTGDEGLLSEAIEMGHRVAGVLTARGKASELIPPDKAGLLRGMSGPGLLFLHLHAATGDSKYLDLARSALHWDLARGQFLDNDTFQLVEPGARTRYLIYLDGGSAGFAMVAHEYLRHREDAQLSAAVAGVRRACRSRLVREPGLIRGRSGFIAALAHLGHAEDRPVIDDHVRRLAWHAQPYKGHLSFPGIKLLRMSMDVATGNAGILLALNAAFESEGHPVLPYLDPRFSAPVDRERR